MAINLNGLTDLKVVPVGNKSRHIFCRKIVIKKEGINNEYTCNNTRLRKEMESMKFTSINDSIKELYAWYEFNKNR